jgi:hypothetical protein
LVFTIFVSIERKRPSKVILNWVWFTIGLTCCPKNCWIKNRFHFPFRIVQSPLKAIEWYPRGLGVDQCLKTFPAKSCIVCKVVFLKPQLIVVDTIYYYQNGKKNMGPIPIFKRIPMTKICIIWIMHKYIMNF